MSGSFLEVALAHHVWATTQLIEACLFISHPRSRSGEIRYCEFSVHPRGLGYHGPGPLPSGFRVHDLLDEELSAAGEQLYDLLRRFRGYTSAMVDWDAEEQVDIELLESDFLPSGFDPAGLVLIDGLAERLGLDGFIPFAPGHSWLPYRGSMNPWRRSPTGQP